MLTLGAQSVRDGRDVFPHRLLRDLSSPAEGSWQRRSRLIIPALAYKGLGFDLINIFKALCARIIGALSIMAALALSAFAIV